MSLWFLSFPLHTVCSSQTAYSERPPVFLGRSLDLLWAVWVQHRLTSCLTPVCTFSQSPQLHLNSTISPLLMQPLVLHFGFQLAFACQPPSVVYFRCRHEGGNAAAFRAHLISWAGERERYGRYSWDISGVPAPAETYSKLLQPKMVRVPSPGSWLLVVGLLAEPSWSDSQEDVGSGPCPLIAWLLLRALRSRP